MFFTQPCFRTLTFLAEEAIVDVRLPALALMCYPEGRQVGSYTRNEISNTQAAHRGLLLNHVCNEAALRCLRDPLLAVDYFLTASFNALAAVNLGALVAGILIGLPVLGLTP